MSVSVPVIESAQNERYKQWRRYVLHPESNDCPWIFMENPKQIEELSEDRSIELLLFSEREDVRVRKLLARARRSCQLSSRLLHRLSRVDSFQGILAFFEKPRWRWHDLTNWVLYLDRLQDPGNVGTLVRTARATGIFSLVTSHNTVSYFNAKVVRASAGLLFAVPCVQGVGVKELKERGYRLWACSAQGGSSLFEARFQEPLAVLIGNEGSGLQEQTLAIADHQVHIPMVGGAESLNAAVAGSLLLYEVWRQREGHG